MAVFLMAHEMSLNGHVEEVKGVGMLVAEGTGEEDTRAYGAGEEGRWTEVTAEGVRNTFINRVIIASKSVKHMVRAEASLVAASSPCRF